MGSIPLFRAGPANEAAVVEAEPVAKRLKLAQCSDSTDAKQEKHTNTTRSTAWAVKTFQDWKEERNESFPDDRVPDDILDQMYDDVSPLIHWLSRFLVEARNKEGKMYSLCSLHGLMCGILRYMRAKNPYAPNFMDKNDPRFKELHGLMNTTFANLREHGVRIYRKEIPFITMEKENELWERGIMGTDSPISLQRAVFFMISKTLYIKGGFEHRALKPSQFMRDRNPDGYTFTDTGRGSNLKSSHHRKVYANNSAGNRCLVHLLDLYFLKLPSYAYDKDILYLRPKANFLPKETRAPWYETFPVGREKLRTMTRDMCVDGGMLKGSEPKPVQPSTSSVPPGHAVSLRQPFLIHYQPLPTSLGKEQSGVCLVPVSASSGSSEGVHSPNIPIVKVILPDNGHRDLMQLCTGQLQVVQPINGCQTSVQSNDGPQKSADSHGTSTQSSFDPGKTPLDSCHATSIGPHSDLWKASHHVTPDQSSASVRPSTSYRCPPVRPCTLTSVHPSDGHQPTDSRQSADSCLTPIQLDDGHMMSVQRSESHVASVQVNNGHQILSVRLSDDCQLSNAHKVPNVELINSELVESSIERQKLVQSDGARHPIKMPQLKGRPSREHYEVISKIMSAIEKSDDPDLHCVYVCVHKCGRSPKGEKNHAAEAPF